MNTDLKRQLLQEKVCGTKHEFVRARLCFSYFATRSDNIVLNQFVNTSAFSCALITRVLVDMQNDASQLKQETDDLKQQLLAAQVRHNRICIMCVCVGRFDISLNFSF